MKIRETTETGQAIVIIAISLIVLLGFTALAVDGSMVYSDRRNAQNAADSSSLAGGGAAAMSLEKNEIFSTDWDCTSVGVKNAMNAALSAAISRASTNNYIIDNDADDLHGATAVCGKYTTYWVDKYIDVTTYISDTTQTYFASLIYGRDIVNNVSAVTRIRPRTPVAHGMAIVSVATDCHDGGVTFDGDAGVTLNDGGVFSNSCIVANGGVDVEVYGALNACVAEDCYTANGTALVEPLPNDNAEPLKPSDYEIDPPGCDSFSTPDYGKFNAGGVEPISPGWYTEIKVNNDADVVTMAPGLYCIRDDFVTTGGTITGTGVTIYIEDGTFSTNGNATINLAAPDCSEGGSCLGVPLALPGVLIYIPETNAKNEVNLLGDADSDYYGLVYAPAGEIEVGGGSSLMGVIHTQLIGYDVKIHGTTSIDITYDGEKAPQRGAMMELYK